MSEMTLAEWAAEWLDLRDGATRATTQVRQESLVRRHIVGDEILSVTPLAELRRAEVVAFTRRLAHVPNGRGGTLSPKTRLHVHKALSHLLADAVAEGLLDRNPMDRVARPRQHDDEMAHYTLDETRQLIDERHRHHFGPCFALAVLTGLRRGELAGLQWRDVHLEEAWIAVATTRTTAGGAVVTDAPKTRRSRRRVDLPPQGVEILGELADRRDSARAAWGVDWDPDGDTWVIVYEDGSLPHPDRLGDHFARYCAELDLPHYGLHALRHTYASLLAPHTPLLVLKELLGHADIATTQRYLHFEPGHARGAVAALGDALSA